MLLVTTTHNIDNSSQTKLLEGGISTVADSLDSVGDDIIQE
jgi:hypothetical protein